MKSTNRCIAPRGIVSLAFLSLAAGCTTLAPYTPPSFPFRTGYQEARAGAPVLLTNTEWWTALRDPTFDTLVSRALAGNLSLETARARVLEADANRRAIPLQASLSAGAQARQTSGNAVPDTTTTEADLGLNWLLDPYGARRDRIAAAEARTTAAEAGVAAAQLLVLRQLGLAYVDLRYSQRLLALRQEDLARRRQTLEMTRSMMDANSATRLDLVRAEARIAEIQTQIPGIQASIKNQKYQIAVLAGAIPGTLEVNLDHRTGQPHPQMSPKVGIPADILRNRPDIHVNERLYYAAIAETGVARAALYPQLSLTGAITLNALNGGAATSSYFFGPALRLPIFPNDALKGAVAARAAQALQAHVAWKSSVLTALLEVESALSDYSASTGAIRQADRAVRLQREARDLTAELVPAGSATLSDLIDVEDRVADADAARAEILRNLGRSFIQLNVALGSGATHKPDAG